MTSRWQGGDITSKGLLSILTETFVNSPRIQIVLSFGPTSMKLAFFRAFFPAQSIPSITPPPSQKVQPRPAPGDRLAASQEPTSFWAPDILWVVAKSMSHRSETLDFFPIPQRKCQQTVVSTMVSVRGAKWIPSSHRDRPEVGRLMVLRPGFAPRTSPLRDCYVQMRPEIKRLQTEPHSAQRQGKQRRGNIRARPRLQQVPQIDTPCIHGLVPSA